MKRRGFMLILSLLLICLMLVVGLGFLGVRSLEYGSTPKFQQQALAQSLAEGGMEDARVKLEKDMFFPPLGGYNQTTFTYSEDVTDPDNAVVIGSYTVTIETQRRELPYRILRILSVGTAGSRTDPTARYRIYAEMDVCNSDRTNLANPNPNLFRFINWREGDVEAPMPSQQLGQ